MQLDWNSIKETLGLGTRTDSGQTIGALLARKQEVSSQLKGRREERPLQPTTGPTRTPTGRTAEKPKPRSAGPPEPPPTTESTTSRLLEAKRRQQQKRDEEK